MTLVPAASCSWVEVALKDCQELVGLASMMGPLMPLTETWRSAWLGLARERPRE